MEIILASTSRYRQRLLERLGLPFRTRAPGTDESPRCGESPSALALRLATEKSRAVAAHNPAALVIGSDQVASLDNRILGKPGDLDTARRQLRASSGRELRFHTGLALVCEDREISLSHVEPFSVHFRQLEHAEIDDYLQREQPFDCAGSFRWEGLGIALFHHLRGDDPTALEGLPLISLCRLLNQAGCAVLAVPR